jgi:hypothetical protein
MIKCIYKTSWVAPLVSTTIVVAAFVSTIMGLFPLPYYFSSILPFVLFANILIIGYQAFFKKAEFIKTSLISIVPFGLSYLWFIQTA